MSFFNTADQYAGRKETIMEMKKVLAGWSKICPGCNIGRKYPDSFIGKKVRNHWETDNPSKVSFNTLEFYILYERQKVS